MTSFGNHEKLDHERTHGVSLTNSLIGNVTARTRTQKHNCRVGLNQTAGPPSHVNPHAEAEIQAWKVMKGIAELV